MHLTYFLWCVYTCCTNMSRTSHLETTFVDIRMNRSPDSNFWHQIPVTCCIMMKEQEE